MPALTVLRTVSARAAKLHQPWVSRKGFSIFLLPTSQHTPSYLTSTPSEPPEGRRSSALSAADQPRLGPHSSPQKNALPADGAGRDMVAATCTGDEALRVRVMTALSTGSDASQSSAIMV